MKHLQRVFALCLTLIVLLGCMTAGVAFADGGTKVNFRLVLHKYMSYSSCTVHLEQYADMTSETPINTQQFSIGSSDLWEREVELEPGFYEVTYVSVLGSWQAREHGNTERFEVKGDIMTVYIAVDTDDKPAELPPQWLVYGEDTQKHHLWDGNPDFIIGNGDEETTKPTEPDTTDPVPGETLPEGGDNGTEEGDGPNRPDAPTAPSMPDDNDKPEEPVKDSVRIGNIVFYVAIALIFVVCFILLRKIQKERGA